MRFDFDTPIDRRGTNSVKWDENPDVLPLWIADMDFRTAPCIIEALRKKVEHGNFGYTLIPDGYYNAVSEWFGKRHGWKIERDWIVPVDGIVPATSIAIKALTEPGDEVIMHIPAYNCFFSSIRNTGCILSGSPLKYEDGRYSMDFEDIERRCSSPRAKAFILCNPHNPSGRLWTREELERLSEICRRHSVTVISDEIHCEIVPPGSSYVPYATVSPEAAMDSITFASPTKPFSIPGVAIANIISKNPDYRKRMDRVINDWEHCDMNQFGVVALEAAYSEDGAAWLDEMNAYVHENYLFLKDKLGKSLPQLHVCELESTYLAWVDCSSIQGASTEEICSSLIEKEKVWINSGSTYGDGRFVRINLGCPRVILEDALGRIISGFKRYIS